MGDIKPDRSAVPDAEIVQLVLGGEIDVFDELVHRTRRPAYRLARRITRNHEDADDVVQESYVKAYRALGRFEAASPLPPRVFSPPPGAAARPGRNKARRGGGRPPVRACGRARPPPPRTPPPPRRPR